MKKLSAEQIESVFTKVTEIRLARTTKLAWEGLTLMKFASWSNSLFWFIDTYVVGLIPTNWLANLMFAGSVGAYQSTTLPPPKPVYEAPAKAEEASTVEQIAVPVESKN